MIFKTGHCIRRWHGNGATLRNLLTGAEETVAGPAPVRATTNLAIDPFPERFPGKITQRIGDCAAPRQAAHAFPEGRKAALALQTAWGTGRLRKPAGCRLRLTGRAGLREGRRKVLLP